MHGVMMYFLMHFLVRLTQIRTLIHRLLYLLWLSLKVIQINLTLFQSKYKLFKGMAWINKSSVLSIRIGIITPKASC